jgi:hypothetical protein
MALIEWNDDLALGLHKVDQEHRELVALVSDVFHTANSHRDLGLFEWRMDLLIKHALAQLCLRRTPDARDELSGQATTPASASSADHASPSIANGIDRRFSRLQRGDDSPDPRLAARAYNRG